MTDEYGRWCQRRYQLGDCLSLLVDTPSLDEDGRYTWALSIALDSVWEETKEALRVMADPQAIKATLMSAMAMYLMLWVMPEPVSKGVATALTAALLAYLGFDTVWGLIQGWRRLVTSVEAASTPEQVYEAGSRFGKLLGRNAARIFIVLTTAAVGSTLGLAGKLPKLPGYDSATTVAATQGGFRLSALSELQTIAISGQGIITISLAASALAMSAPPEDSPGSGLMGTAGGPRAGKGFTSAGKKKIDADNAKKNGGVNKCEKCGDNVVAGQQNQRGVTPPRNQRERDHIVPKSQGGDGSPSNGQILCRGCNLEKSDSVP